MTLESPVIIQSHNHASPPQVTLPLVARRNEATPSPNPNSNSNTRRSRVTPSPDADGTDLEDPGVEATSNTTQLPAPSVGPAIKQRFVDVIRAFSLLKFLAAIAAVFIIFNVARWSHSYAANRERDSSSFQLARFSADSKEVSDKLDTIQAHVGALASVLTAQVKSVGSSVTKAEEEFLAHISSVKNELIELKGENKLDPKIDPLQNAVVANVSLLIPCNEKHFGLLSDVMQSVRMQTRMPFETIIALSIADTRSKEIDIQEIGKAALAMPTPFKVHVRGGTHYAGSNRQFLLDHATADVVSWFDCDDFMHPRRIEMIDRAFKSNTELEAALHGYKYFNRTNWNVTSRLTFLQTKLNDTGMDNWEPEWPFEELWDKPPFTKLYDNKTWDINDPTTEPNRGTNVKTHWFFPIDMDLRHVRVSCHNGWLSMRRRAAALVPYPTDVWRGQDSLFNWRLIKSHINFSVIQHPLGAYIFGPPPRVPTQDT